MSESFPTQSLVQSSLLSSQLYIWQQSDRLCWPIAEMSFAIVLGITQILSQKLGYGDIDV